MAHCMYVCMCVCMNGGMHERRIWLSYLTITMRWLLSSLVLLLALEGVAANLATYIHI